MAGFFYLMLGMVLSVGLNPLDSGAVLSGWVMVQPRIAFVTAAGFWILAVVLLKRSAMSVRLARVGVYASIGFAVLNGISLHLAFGVRFHMIGLLMILTGGMVGLWLGVMVRRYGKHMQESGGLGSGAVL
jgi:hypothetical protein